MRGKKIKEVACALQMNTKRILGSNRLGYSRQLTATDKDVAEAVRKIAVNNNVSEVEIDALLWNFCADGYGAICKAVLKHWIQHEYLFILLMIYIAKKMNH